MGKGTPSQGRHNSHKVHIPCRRCGKHAYHAR
ncbi:MAG: 50S ribosomal protein L37e, partial [Candidatus Methanomethylophilaceae archaeon]